MNTQEIQQQIDKLRIVYLPDPENADYLDAVLRQAADTMEAMLKENERLNKQTASMNHAAHAYEGSLEDSLKLQELLESKLHDIETWCRAYPETVFIEPTKRQWAEADRVLNKAGGCSLTAISGSNMRPSSTQGTDMTVQEQITELISVEEFIKVRHGDGIYTVERLKLCKNKMKKAINTMEAMHQENKELHEQVAVLQSKEVCIEPHEDSIIDGCPYCRLEALLKRQELLEKVVDTNEIVMNYPDIREFLGSETSQIVDRARAALGDTKTQATPESTAPE